MLKELSVVHTAIIATKTIFPHEINSYFFHEINKQQQVATCDVCQRVNTKLVNMPAELHPVSVHLPWHHPGIDIGHISPSLAGNR